ncbi:right-handed parallel beta-helix repeat-containing protein, partial [bacterium]|nr:right-handed parallel beta-helix repeat-containing protein [bacterium]
MKNWHVIMIVCFLLVSCPAARATDFYVAPDGNDAWSGELPTPNESRTDGPLATFRAARDAARKLGPKKPRRILARGGDYFLGQTFALEAQDSG